ncbi:uncharacterized protein LOC141649019 [Silene latifolia]|uniref:uncharacterized protein LOC141649019 n=1 Tax=Silene latifolia TaxID=37657 RepID=UPI003D77BEDA
MEYLSRILHYTTTSMPFKHHPLCSKMKLTHLMFADNLLLFSKGDIESIMILLRSFATFSCASGLQMSPAKTNAYFNGVQHWVKLDILQVAGFTEGQLPFRYLGVPITCGRMKKSDCNILVEKLVSRIRSFGSRKLSYDGRLLLVNSVLTALYSYWVNIFVIPKGVLNKVNVICRNYLWDGSADYIRVPLVSWEKVCSPKHEGGLGIRDSLAWNYATIGKLVWWIYCCPNRVRDMLASGYSNDQWILSTKGYSVSQGYELLRNKFQSMVWSSHIWNNWCLPKHQFVGWLIQRNALQLKGKLFSLGIVSDDLCMLCSNASETVEHLFQNCEYSRRLLDLFPRSVAWYCLMPILSCGLGSVQLQKLKKGFCCLSCSLSFIKSGCRGTRQELREAFYGLS